MRRLGPSSMALRLTNYVCSTSSIRNFNISYVRTQDPQKLHANSELSALLENNDLRPAYKFVLANSKKGISNEIAEVFVVRLLEQGRVSAAAGIFPLFKRDINIKLSNETWSLFLSEVCESGNYMGATLIYHELIDNYSAYEAGSQLSFRCFDSVPFLVSREILEQLAVTFVQAKDSIRIEGLLQYFKKFYSYLQHGESYAALKIALIEAHSHSKDTSSALKEYKNYALSLKGLWNHFKKLNSLMMLKFNQFKTFQERRESIRKNLNNYSPGSSPNEFDEREIEIAREQGADLYYPLVQRNVYSNHDGRHMPVLNGTIRSADFPYFSELIFENVNKVMQEKRIEPNSSFIRLIKTYHFSLLIFVTAALCELGQIKQAFLLIGALQSQFPKKHFSILFPDECFIILFRACKRELQQENSNSTSLLKLVLEIRDFYFSLLYSPCWVTLSPEVYAAYISALLTCEDLATTSLKTELDQYIKLQKQPLPKSILRMPKKSFKKLRTILGDDFNSYSKHVECM